MTAPQPNRQPPSRLEALGWAGLVLAAVSAMVIAIDMALRGYRQRM